MLELLSLILVKANNARLIQLFCEAKVQFIVIGGAAVAIHGCREITSVNDLDLLVSPTEDNAKKILSAFKAAQIEFPEHYSSKLTQSAIQIPIKNYMYHAELLTPLNVIDFEEMLKASIPLTIKSNTVFIATRDDLIRMKEITVNEISKNLTKHEQDLNCLRNL